MQEVTDQMYIPTIMHACSQLQPTAVTALFERAQLDREQSTVNLETFVVEIPVDYEIKCHEIVSTLNFKTAKINIRARAPARTYVRTVYIYTALSSYSSIQLQF